MKLLSGTFAILASLLLLSEKSFAYPVNCNANNRGRLMSVELMMTKNKTQLKAYFDDWMAVYGSFMELVEPEVDYGAKVYKVTYCTVDFDGTPTVASGVFSVPQKTASQPSRNFATVLYEHGTSVTRNDTPSNLNVEETFDGPTPLVFFTGAGFIYVAPDYLGYGESNLPRHRYFHAKTEASASIDLMSAVEEAPAYDAAPKKDKLFLFGFSQGGHVSLATHRKLEEMYPGRPVTANATIGGVYNVEQWLINNTFNPSPDAIPEYLNLYNSFATLAYDDVYDTYSNINNVFKAPYASQVEGLFDMSMIFDDVAFSLPPTSQELFTNAWRNQLQNSPSMEFRQRLRQNEVYKWVPRAPLKAIHSITDEEVPFAVANDAYQYMDNHGAPIYVRQLQDLDHLNSWHHAMPIAIDWFKSF